MDREALRAQVLQVIAHAERVDTHCGHGTMPFRRWNEGGGEIVVLLHGGSGSWNHWVANIPELASEFELIIPDLPGLGDAATLPDGYTAADAAHWVAEGINRIDALGYHLIGFSWGATVASIVAARHNPVLKSLMLVGPAALGDLPRRSQMEPLLRRRPDMTEAEIFEVNRENLARLMIHDRSRIDDLAVWMQTENTRRSRFNSPQFARSTLVLDHLGRVTRPLKVVYGEFDAPAYPDIAGREARLREVRPDLEFETVAGAGHWVQYEAPDRFNQLARDWVRANA